MRIVICQSKVKSIPIFLFIQVEVIKVKITKDEDKLKLFKDAIVSIPVSIVAVNGNLYYTQSDFLTVSNNTNKDTQK